MPHSKYYAPSSMERRLLCPGSATLEVMAIEKDGDPSSPPADRGAACHYMTAVNLTDGTRPQYFLGYDVEVHDAEAGEPIRTYKVDDDMVADTKTALANVRRLMRRYPNADVRIETSVNSDALVAEDMFGTADIILDDMPNVLAIVDHKFGQVYVDARSTQNLCYAVMSLEDPGVFDLYDKVIVAVNQPARPDAKGKTMREYTLKKGELVFWYNDILVPGIARIQGGDTTRNPSEKACNYCKGKKYCDEYNAVALQMVQLKFEAEITTPIITDEMVNKGYVHLPLLEKWIRDFKERARVLVEQGELVDHKLVAGRGRREWIDEDGAAEVIKAAGHDAYVNKILTPAAAEKLKGVKAKVKGLINSVPGAPVIAHVSSPKKAIESVVDKFKKETEKDG